MADNKKKREREILDEVYADRTFSEIEPHESPDFLIRPHPRAERFGVEISEFYLTEGHARLDRIEGYRAELLDGRPEFDLNAVELEITDQDGAGFRTLLGWEQGMDLALRIAVAVTRYRYHIGS